MIQVVLFIAAALLLLGLLYIIWQIWWSYTDVTPEDEAFDDRVARLNDRQANRYSDGELRQQLSPEDAWQLMIERGRGHRRRRRRRR